MKLSSILSAAVILAMLVGCDSGAKSARGFRLPDGDVEKGKVVFADLKCTTCHTVAGVELTKPEPAGPVTVVLGGEVRRVQTYGQLVTSIINPSHSLAKGYPKDKITADGKSLMTNFNNVMTVTQLTDLVSFLQAQYKIKVDDTLYYPYM